MGSVALETREMALFLPHAPLQMSANRVCKLRGRVPVPADQSFPPFAG